MNPNSRFHILYSTRYARIALVLAIVFVLATPVAIILAKNNSHSSQNISQPAFIASTDTNSPNTTRTVTYYLTTSQEFLNKARYLANTNKNQTPEDKQKIVSTINQALDLANQAIAAYPHEDNTFAQRSSIYQSLTPFAPNTLQLAIQDLKEAIRLNPQNPQYHTRLATLYVSLNDFTNAATSYHNAYLLTAPPDVQTVFQLADSLERCNQLDKAAHYFDQLISLLPPDDTNLDAVKTRQANLKARLADQTRATFGLASPTPYNEMLGTQELPLEQAAAKTRIVIAGPQDANNDQNDSALQSNTTSGESILSANQTAVTIINSIVSGNKQIVIVPTTDTQNHPLTLLSKKDGSFQVGLDKPVDFVIKFKWFVVD